MRNFQKSKKARFNASEIQLAIENAASQAISTIEASPTGSRSGSINTRRGPVQGKHSRASAAATIDPAVAAVKQFSGVRIFGTDPDALHKLNLKLASMLALQDNMQRTNAFIDNQDRAGLLRFGYSAEGIEELFLCGPGQTPGYSQQELANMAVNIERVRDRIAVLSGNLDRPEKLEQGRDFQYHEDPAQQRVVFAFPSKPILTVRQLLGQSGFRWTATRSAWIRPLSDSSIAAAETVRQALQAVPNILEKKMSITLH
jgi:hypothetical protein